MNPVILFLFIWPVLLLVSCDRADDTSQDSSIESIQVEKNQNTIPLQEPLQAIQQKPDTVNTSGSPLKSALDLTIQDDMLDDIIDKDPPHTEQPMSSQFLSNKNTQKTVTLGGKIHLDKNEEDYKEKVEGAEFNVEIKFK